MLLLLFGAFPSCVTREGGAPAPSGGGDRDPRELWHEDVLRQCEEAWKDEDEERLRSLLANPRSGAGRDQLERYARYELLAEVLEVRGRGFSVKGLLPRDPPEDAVRLEGGELLVDLEQARMCCCRIRPAPGNEAWIRPGAGGAIAGVFQAEIEELEIRGDWIRRSRPLRLEIRGARRLTEDSSLEIVFPPLWEDRPTIVFRRVRLKGRLVCGAFSWNGRELPLFSLELDPLSIVQLPKGWRRIRKAPLETFETAAKHPERYPGHLLIAAWFLGLEGTEADRKRAMRSVLKLLRTPAPGVEALLLRVLAFLDPVAAERLGGDRNAWFRYADPPRKERKR